MNKNNLKQEIPKKYRENKNKNKKMCPLLVVFHGLGIWYLLVFVSSVMEAEIGGLFCSSATVVKMKRFGVCTTSQGHCSYASGHDV